MPRLPAGQQPRKTVALRMPEGVWEAAKEAADRRGETLTAAVERFLKRYGKS